VRFGQHRRVIEGIAGGDDVVVQQLERGHGALLLFGHAQLVARDEVVLDHQPMVPQRRPGELAQQRRGDWRGLESTYRENWVETP
jgi:hypothetical protein